MALFTSNATNLLAHFDESVSQGNLPVIAVAGYLFEPKAYLKFDGGMKAMLKEFNLEYFRMFECQRESDQFEQHKGTVRVLEAELEVIRLIRENAVLGVAAGVSEARFRLMQPMHAESALGGPYSMLCQWCLAEIGRWGDKNNFQGDIAYFFESGYKDEKEASAAIAHINRYPALKNAYRYGSHSFVDKKKMRGLQAADLLAWFARKETEAHRQIAAGVEPIPRRRDFQALIGETEAGLNLIKHSFQPFHDQVLKEHLAANCDPSMLWWKPNQ